MEVSYTEVAKLLAYGIIAATVVQLFKGKWNHWVVAIFAFVATALVAWQYFDSAAYAVLVAITASAVYAVVFNGSKLGEALRQRFLTRLFEVLSHTVASISGAVKDTSSGNR